MHVLSVGDRVSSNKDFAHGTVRYIGVLDGDKDEWIGVEWDDCSRGKHDGIASLNGKRYFQGRFPNGSSFVRSWNICELVTCSHAIISKYAECDKLDCEKKGTPKIVKFARFVELVGMDIINKKQSQLHLLKYASLYNCNVYGDVPPRLHILCPNIEKIDLSNTLLPSWERVSEIITQLPLLSFVDLSKNRIYPYYLCSSNISSDGSDNQNLTDSNMDQWENCRGKPFLKIDTVFLNSMNYVWADVLHVMHYFPSLSCISLFGNAIDKLTPFQSQLFSNLRSMNLSSNLISNFNEVHHLSNIPCLKVLILSHNKIKNVDFYDDGNVFPSLQSIVLSHNEIDSWSSVNNLSKLPSLKSLVLTANPINATESEDTFRHLLLASLPSITSFNGSDISREERKSAEIFYLRRFSSDWSKAGGKSAEETRDQDLWKTFSYRHPQYERLCAKWGDPGNELKATSGKIRDDVVSVLFVYREPDSWKEKVVQRNVLRSMCIQKIRFLASLLFGIPQEDISLLLSHAGSLPLRIDVDRDRNLDFYDVHDGDKIIIDREG